MVGVLMSQIEGQPPLPHVNIRPSYRGVPVLDRGLLPGPGRDVPNIGCDMAPAFGSQAALLGHTSPHPHILNGGDSTLSLISLVYLYVER